jgi:cystathionine beta-synthase
MLLEAEKRGEIKKGDYVIESTSGNTGIGIAMTAMNRGMKAIITIPCKMSMEKVNILKGLGAEVHICDTTAPSGHPDK